MFYAEYGAKERQVWAETCVGVVYKNMDTSFSIEMEAFTGLFQLLFFISQIMT